MQIPWIPYVTNKQNATMLLNYLKLSFRLMSRNPFFTLINLLGLSTGFAVFLVLWQHSQHEIQSDQFHDDWQNIVRLTFQVDDLVFPFRSSEALRMKF